jgi:hypothetical protein
MQRAIEPALALSQILRQWDQITAQLREKPRRRQMQIKKHFS